MRRVERRILRIRVGIWTDEVNRPVEWTGRADLSLLQRFCVHHACFAVVAEAYERGHAVVEKCFAVVPVVFHLRVPQPRQNVFAIRIDDLGICRTVLPLPPNIGDPVSLDNDLNITNRHAAVSVDERSTLDDEYRGARSTLRERWTCITGA